MKFYTSYYANFRHIPKDFMCIGISRYFQDYFKRTDIPNFLYTPNNVLAPSEKLLLAMKKGLITEEQYEYYYVQGLQEGLARMGYQSETMYYEALLREFDNTPGVSAVVFLCYEKPGEFCHRNILSKRMRELGYDCRELTSEDIRSSKSGGNPVQSELF